MLSRSPLQLWVPSCTRSAAPLWALLRLPLLPSNLALLKLLVGSLPPVDVLSVDSGSGAQARDRASWLARGLAPLSNATLLPRCRMLNLWMREAFLSRLAPGPGAFRLKNWRTGR